MGILTSVYSKFWHRDPIASTSAVHPATSQPRTSFLKPWLYECNNACIFLTISLLAACSARTAVYYLASLHSGTAPGPWKLPQSLTMAGYRSSIFYEPLLMTLFRRANRFSLTVCMCSRVIQIWLFLDFHHFTWLNQCFYMSRFRKYMNGTPCFCQKRENLLQRLSFLL